MFLYYALTLFLTLGLIRQAKLIVGEIKTSNLLVNSRTRQPIAPDIVSLTKLNL